jgi:hypothetical protein
MHTFSSAVGGAGVEPREPSTKASSNQDYSGAWAAALAHTVRQQFFTLHNGDSAEPSPGNASDGSLTQKSMRVDADVEATGGVLPGASNEASSNVLAGQVDGGELGLVRFSVVRGAEGLEVVIGVENVEQRALLEVESEALVRAIQGSGLRVQSVSITTEPQAGIALAQVSLQAATNSSFKGSPRILTKSQHSAEAYRSQQQSEPEEGDLDLMG